MRVLHIIEGVDKNLGGQPVALFGILKMEEHIGVTSDILSTEPPAGTFNKHLFSQQFRFFESSFPKRYYRSKGAIRWLRQNIDNYELIIFHGIWNFLVFESFLLAVKARKRYIIWPHGSLVPYDLKKKYFLKRIIGNLLLKKVLANAYRLCLTSQTENQVLEKFRATIKTVILPLPVDNKFDIIDQFSAENVFTPFTFLYMGRLDKKKGLELTIEAFEIIHKKFGNIKLDIWGTGDKNYTNTILTLIKDKKLEQKVSLNGFLDVNRKQEVFLKAGCFMLASKYENFGIAPIEALQAGLPVLITDNVFIWHDIAEAGWVATYSLKSVTTLMEDVLSNKDRYVSKRRLSQQIGNKFRTDNLAPLYRNFYADLLNKKA